MAGVAPKLSAVELVIDFAGRRSARLSLVLDQYRVGRGSANEISFPEDAKLSREHLLVERNAGAWQVRDLGSTNGTRVNGTRITEPVPLRDGDCIAAGNLSMIFRAWRESGGETVVLFDKGENRGSQTISTNLKAALQTGTDIARLQSKHLRALLQAGRELAGYCTLHQLFDLVLNLSAAAAEADRGVLMTEERGALVVRSSRGQHFSISSFARDRVLRGESLLICDVQSNHDFAARASIVCDNIGSIVAVPLQTESGVIGLIYLDSPRSVRQFTSDDLSLLTVMANIAAIRIEHARLLEVEQAERQLARELERAAEIQSRLLPADHPDWPGLDVAGYNAACRTVGGDYYDFWRYETGEVAVVVADVSGKGMPAALLMSNLQACTRVLFETADDLAQNVVRLNRAIANITPENAFITFFAGIIDVNRETLTYCNAGHNPPLLLKRTGGVERLSATGTVLGLLPKAVYSDEVCSFKSGDSLLLFSDGVSEASRSGSEDEFGEERLIQLFEASRNVSAYEILQRIKAELTAFTAGIPAADDVTLVAVIAR